MNAQKSNKNANTIIVLNSLIYFLLAYFFVIFIYNFFSLILAEIVGVDATMYYFGVLHDEPDMSKRKTFVIFFIGPWISFFMGFLFKYLYEKKRKHLSNFKLFLLWTYIISYTVFFGGLIIGSFYNFGIGSSFIVLNIPITVKFIFALIGIASLLVLGYYSQKNVVISAISYFSKISGHKIVKFFGLQMLLPTIFGLIIVMLLKVPHLTFFRYLDLLTLFMIFVFIFGLFLFYGKLKSLAFKHKSDSFRFAYGPLILLVIIIILWRTVLANGISL